MSSDRFPGKRRARFQRGFALIAVLALAALIAAFLISSALNRSSADISNERGQRTRDALLQAKTALIAYAASETYQLLRTPPPTGYFQPGALPCPDQDDDGDADCVGALITATSSIIGRFPFKTVGADDLRDASGERLWYAISHDFRKLQCSGSTTPPNCTVINSDTQGQLTVVGTQPASQVVAIVFAPGPALQGQNRDPANATAHNGPLNYLEGPPNLSDPVNYVFTTAAPSPTFNDQLLVITKADLMAAVEPAVAANIARDIRQLVRNYNTKWGTYPFPMTFSSPPSSNTSYYGASGQTKGLLPLTDDPNWFKWANATVTQIIPGGTGTSTVTSWDCPMSSSPLQVVCRIDYTGASTDRPDVIVRVFLQNANTSFADIPAPFTTPENLMMLDHGGNPLGYVGPGYGYWSAIGPAPLPVQSFATQTPVVAQTGVLSYTGRLQNAGDTNNRVYIIIPLPTPKYLPIVSADSTVNPSGSWFIANQWYRQTYYAVSSGYVSGGDPTTCTSPTKTSCLTVKYVPTPTDDKRVLVVLAGRSLNGSSRPSGNLADYFENANLSAANGSVPFVYENHAGAPTTINDRVVVISP